MDAYGGFNSPKLDPDFSLIVGNGLELPERYVLLILSRHVSDRWKSYDKPNLFISNCLL
jgi:hypothetical protein